jgi:Reverse transcriptase (RNA-dependent DNA polymerase)
MAKRKKWKELLDTVNQDPWGKAYKIATGKIREKTPSPDAEQRMVIAKSLFPVHPVTTWTAEAIDGKDAAPFSEAEVLAAAKKIKMGKAPGPDGIPPAVVKMFLQKKIKDATAMMNGIFAKETFPEAWKKAVLVLIPKPKKAEETTVKYRPICLLDVMGKVYERLILRRLEKDLQEGAGLSEEQYGFRKGRSTVDAIRRVLQLAKEGEAEVVGYKNKPVSALIAFDVQNAFNSAPWPGIMTALSRKGISSHIMNTIKSYLSDRKLEVVPGVSLQVTCGVPQGSILGPTLWNVFYDEMLETRIPHTTLVGYADDLIAVIKAKDKNSLEERGSATLQGILEKANSMGITIAAHKTEAIVARGRRKVTSASFLAGGTTVTTKEEMKYLGVILNRNLSMAAHVDYTAAKATRAMGKLMCLMPNKRGPEHRARRVLASAVHSVVLYASPAWEIAARRACHVAKLVKVQRVINIRVTQAYRTASSAALCVVAGYPPVGLMIEKHSMRYLGGAQCKARAESETSARWQRSWDEAPNGHWTRCLIPNIRAWLDRGYGETEYFLTQFLTGHGNFKTYLARIGKSEDTSCYHCGGEDHPGHAILECPQWADLRRSMESAVDRILTPETIVTTMTESEAGWKTIHSFIRRVLSEKEKEDQELTQNGGTP